MCGLLCDFCRFPITVAFGVVAVFGMLSIGMVLARGLEASWAANPLNVVTPFVLTLTAMAACWVVHSLPSLRDAVRELEDENQEFKRNNSQLAVQVQQLGGSVEELKRRNTELTLENERLEFNVGNYSNSNDQLKANVADYCKQVGTLAARVTDLQRDNLRYQELNCELDGANKELALRTSQLLGYMQQIPELSSTIFDRVKEIMQQQDQKGDRIADLLHQLLVQRLNYVFDQACLDRKKGMSREDYELFTRDLDGELRARFRALPAAARDFGRYATPGKDCIEREAGFRRLRQAILEAPVTADYAASHVRPVRGAATAATPDDGPTDDIEKARLRKEAGLLRSMNETFHKLAADLQVKLEQRDAENGHLRSVNETMQNTLSRAAALAHEEEEDAATKGAQSYTLVTLQDVVIGAQMEELRFLFDQTAKDPGKGLDKAEFRGLLCKLQGELKTKFALLPPSSVTFDRFASPAGRIARDGGFRDFCNAVVNVPLASTKQRKVPRDFAAPPLFKGQLGAATPKPPPHHEDCRFIQID